jgi:hypothetical protein
MYVIKYFRHSKHKLLTKKTNDLTNFSYDY